MLLKRSYGRRRMGTTKPLTNESSGVHVADDAVIFDQLISHQRTDQGSWVALIQSLPWAWVRSRALLPA